MKHTKLMLALLVSFSTQASTANLGWANVSESKNNFGGIYRYSLSEKKNKYIKVAIGYCNSPCRTKIDCWAGLACIWYRCFDDPENGTYIC